MITRSPTPDMTTHRIASPVERRRGRASALAALLLIPLASGCTTFTDYNEETEEARAAFVRGDFARAVEGYKEGLDAVNDSVLYHFEAATAAHVGGMHKQSIDLFAVAYKEVDEYLFRSLAADAGQQVASILLNEKAISYKGEAFEQVMMQAYQARNRYLAGQRDVVIAEVLRCYDIQKRARQLYEKELAEAQAEARKSEGVEVSAVESEMRKAYRYGDLSTAEDVYDLRYVRYLNAFLREACADDRADFNAAWIDVQYVADRFGGEEFVRRDLARLARKSGSPEDARAAEQGLPPLPRNAGSVALFFECGMAPRKEEIKVIFPTLHGAAAVAMPKYVAVPNPAAAAVLVVGDQQVRTVTLTNLETVAFRYHEDRLPLLIAKQVIRLAAKVAIQEGGHAVIANNAGENAELWAALFSIGMSIYNIASEQADLRAWRTLPQTLQAARVYLPEGEYPARVVLLGPGGNALREVDLGMITVKADRHRMINARSIGTQLFVTVSREPYDRKADPAPAGPTTVVQDLRQPDARPRPERHAPVETSETTDLRRPDTRRPPPPVETSEATDLRRPDASAPAPSDPAPSDPLAPGTGDPLDRLARLLQPGSPLCFQIVFENGQGRDVAGNARVDELRDEHDDQGRRLVVMTSNFNHGGVAHYFCFVIRHDGIEQIDLLAAPAGEWEVVPRETFWFKALPGGEVRFEGPGRAIASRRGVVNRDRGAKARAQANVYLRTYEVNGAGPLSY